MTMPRGPRDKGVPTFVSAPPTPSAHTQALVTISTGPDAGRVILLSRKEMASFGRDAECTYASPDTSLSRVHACILYFAGEYMIRDEQSTNGTFVDEVRVNSAARVKDGDRVRLGTRLVMRFSLVTPEEAQALVRLYEAAMRDGLTGAYNRKHFDERLAAEIAFAVRHQTELSVVMIDVDHFKRVNDTYGHPGGDAVLRALSETLRKGLRTEDVLARYGGEELAVIARGIPVTAAGEMAERLRAAIEAMEVPVDGQKARVTASFGVASLGCVAPANDAGALLALADARLYRSKNEGRNRVTVAG
jgi:two-component system, cell cycle response regulator